MISRLLSWAALLLFIAVVCGLAWFYRPWSPFSPARVLQGRDADERVSIYRAMHTYFPYREVRGADEPTRLPRADAQLMPSRITYSYRGASRSLRDYAEVYDITGMMVLKEGQIVLEQYWRGETPDDPHASWSVTKSFVATLVGTALHQGRIKSLNENVETYAPEYAGTDYGTTSIRDVIEMSSGIEFVEDYEDRGSDIRKLFFDTFILNRDIDKQMMRLKRSRPAGTDFQYISPNSIVLAAVVRGAYDGQPLSEVVSEQIFQPLGMVGGTWNTDRNSETAKELAYCCLNMPLSDYAKFGQFYIDGGRVNGLQLVPEGWPDFVGTPPSPSHRVDDRAGRDYVDYGRHFWVHEPSNGVFMAMGYNGQFIWIDPSRRIVIAVTSADAKYPGENEEWMPMLRAVAAAADTI